MSWFTDIAGKAEDLLNKVDQTAATALQTKSKQPYDGGSPYKKNYDEDYSSPASYSPSRALPTQTPSSTSLSGRSSQAAVAPKRTPDSDDEKLLQYLNCNESLPSPNRKGKMQLEPPVKKPTSYVEPLPSKGETMDYFKEENVTPSVESKPASDVTDSILSQPSQNETKNAGISVVQPTSDSPLKSPMGLEETNVGVGQDVLTSEELPKAEVQTNQVEVKRVGKKPEPRTSLLSGNEKAIRELREREKDMSAALDAKDSQLAILKVRLQEADQELAVNRNVMKDLKAENDRIIMEHAQSAAFQNKTVEVLQEQLQQTEAELNKTKESFVQNQKELMQKLGKMEEEHQHLAESYSTLQRKWTELNDKSKELTFQLKQSNGNFDALQQEYNDYKQKAQRILQSKEKLILSLKGGHLDSDTSSSTEAASSLLSAEVEGVKQERDLLREELRRAGELAESYRAEMRELEKVGQGEAAAAQESCRMLRSQLEVERQLREEGQLQAAQMREELQFIREDLTRTKSGFQSRIQEREIEIEKLRRQLTAKSLSTVSQDELESRLHALTENLIQKQTLVEALSTEKNSLVLQLERLEQQLREAQNYGLQQHTYVGINNNETERKAKTVFLDNPFDSALTRRVKRVYGSIDSFSIRLGVFFRRYPIARVFVIIYMLLLHFWVMIVLLTYEPEVHNAGYGTTKQ